jgi:biopolymer transport protein ExbB
MAAAACVWGTVALAQSAAPAAPQVEKVISQSVSMVEVFQKGGWLMYPIAALSVVALAIVIYFFVVLRPEQVVPSVLRRDVVAKINAGAMDDVRITCAYRPCALAEITLVAVDAVQASPGMDPSLLKDVIEGEGSRQAVSIMGQTQYLMDVAVVTPMVGLLGTVFGMMKAFNVVAFDLAKAKPMLLAAGVAEALITTAAGLLVGIPAMMFYAYFRGRAAKMVSQLESASSEVLNALLRARTK